jgi:hypothetical protein
MFHFISKTVNGKSNFYTVKSKPYVTRKDVDNQLITPYLPINLRSSSVGERIIRILLGLPNKNLSCISETSIVIAQDLKPSDTASLDPQMVFGFATAAGGLTSHTSILARTFGRLAYSDDSGLWISDYLLAKRALL